jgi:hypothetical protein
MPFDHHSTGSDCGAIGRKFDLNYAGWSTLHGTPGGAVLDSLDGWMRRDLVTPHLPAGPQALHPRRGSGKTRTLGTNLSLERDVAVLACGHALALGARDLERFDQGGTGLARLDHGINVAAFGGDVGVGETALVVLDQLSLAL